MFLTEHPYRDFLSHLEKPARYVGGEVGARRKDWDSVRAKVCLAFPDVYDIGMSHLGFKILYRILNDHPETLAERCYAPWVDAEKELRSRGLPLISLESYRPLRDFDVVGFSLQFELTYTNILNMMDLGGIPVRSSERGEDDPLIIAGGPVATHPEPLTAFVDAFVIGDGEEKATEVALSWVNGKTAGKSRGERLRDLALLGGVYVPSLYRTAIDESTGLAYVAAPLESGLPLPIERGLVDLKKFPFPDDSPTGGPEAIFDRMSIEVARGCTEGCRFCQAGMIYRPVRERDPEEIINTVLSAIEKSGQDEVSLTALSTADVSCISPLIKSLAGKLAEKRISLGVASLRAYGLEPELLDEIKRVRASGLTFAPEAGTQRMRDVVNKNVTEEQLQTTAERVFSRGFGKMKLYSMIGLPTETDEDVVGIIDMGARTLSTGKRAAKGRAEVTVSVSTHVPKPHTPFQWCAMDTLSEIGRKQGLLKQAVRSHRGLKLRTHESNASVIEGVFARGDRTLSEVLHWVWQQGARFDSWDEQLRLDLWHAGFAKFGIDTAKYLRTIPVNAHLPWDHIDVGLEDGFLAREYRKALQSRLSPPCGKVAGMFVHHTNATEAQADDRRLVCYDCGVACDLSAMKTERVDSLIRLGVRQGTAMARDEARETGGYASEGSPRSTPPKKGTEPTGARIRLRFEKLGPMSMLGHLDLVRALPRVFRRAGIELRYTQGFHPKPDMVFAPALPLGLMSLDEYVDVRLADLVSPEPAAVVERLNRVSQEGLHFLEGMALPDREPALSKRVGQAHYLMAFSAGALGESTDLAALCATAMAKESIPLVREIEGIQKKIDPRMYLEMAREAGESARGVLGRAGLLGDVRCIAIVAKVLNTGACRPSEYVRAILGEDVPHQAVRVALRGVDGESLMSYRPAARPVTDSPIEAAAL